VEGYWNGYRNEKVSNIVCLEPQTEPLVEKPHEKGGRIDETRMEGPLQRTGIQNRVYLRQKKSGANRTIGTPPVPQRAQRIDLDSIPVPGVCLYYTTSCNESIEGNKKGDFK
jgi:hypothetical protein